jgi:hypothetical protein
MGKKGRQDKKQLGLPGQRSCHEKMGENQKHDAHTEGMKVGLFEQSVEVLREKHLSANLAT